jgi:hypothetical protein
MITSRGAAAVHVVEERTRRGGAEEREEGVHFSLTTRL